MDCLGQNLSLWSESHRLRVLHNARLYILLLSSLESFTFLLRVNKIVDKSAGHGEAMNSFTASPIRCQQQTTEERQTMWALQKLSHEGWSGSTQNYPTKAYRDSQELSKISHKHDREYMLISCGDCLSDGYQLSLSSVRTGVHGTTFHVCAYLWKTCETISNKTKTVSDFFHPRWSGSFHRPMRTEMCLALNHSAGAKLLFRDLPVAGPQPASARSATQWVGKLFANFTHVKYCTLPIPRSARQIPDLKTVCLGSGG